MSHIGANYDICMYIKGKEWKALIDLIKIDIGSKSTILNKVLLALEYLNIGFVVYGGDFSTLCNLQLIQFGDVQWVTLLEIIFVLIKER